MNPLVFLGGAVGLLVVYGLWNEPLKPWLEKQFDELCFIVDQRRLRKKYDLHPDADVCESLADFARLLDRLPEGVRDEADELFVELWPRIRGLGFYQAEDWEEVAGV